MVTNVSPVRSISLSLFNSGRSVFAYRWRIRKKTGVIDLEADEKESGEIRIHAIDANNNLDLL